MPGQHEATVMPGQHGATRDSIGQPKQPCRDNIGQPKQSCWDNINIMYSGFPYYFSTDPPSLLIVAYLDISCAVHTVKTCRCSRRRCNFGHFPAAALHCIGVTALLQISLTRLTATKRHSRRSSGSTNWTRTFTMWVKLQPYDSAHPDIF